jgi:hypothetical protein
MKENNNYIYESNDDIDKNLNIDKAINQQNYLSNLNQDQSPENKKNKKKSKVSFDKETSSKKKGELNFKKWLLTLSSIGNLILGALLLIMAISAMRYQLYSIFIADKGLIVLSIIIILSSILCFIGLYISSFHCLLLVFYNYISCDDFNAFNRWLSQVTGKEVISAGNARKIKMSYWAQHAKKQWDIKNALEETNTAQQETKFRNYTLLCDEIRDIIRQG